MPHYSEQIDIVDDILIQLDTEKIPKLYVLNKIDIIKKPQGLIPFNHVKISALKAMESQFNFKNHRVFTLKIIIL